jgi:hypothetical protein
MIRRIAPRSFERIERCASTWRASSPAPVFEKDELPLWLENGRIGSGAIDAGTPNRLDPQIDGGWVAAVEMPARSANGRSRLTVQLWLPPDALT